MRTLPYAGSHFLFSPDSKTLAIQGSKDGRFRSSYMDYSLM